MKKRNRVKLYFAAPRARRAAVVLIPASVVACIVGIVFVAERETMVALIVFLVGVLFVVTFMKYKSLVPSDAQMEVWVEEDLAGLVSRALEECNFDSSAQIRPPEIMISPDFRGVEGVDVLRQKRSDGKIRFSPILVTIVIFTEYQLGIYTCYLDLTSGEPLNEGAHVIAYRFIVASSIVCEDACFSLTELKSLLKVKPEIAELSKGGKITITGAHHFTLTAVADLKLKICLTEPSIKGSKENDEIVKRARKMVQAIQSRLSDVASAEAKSSA